MKTPWHYLTWQPPELEPKAERNLAGMVRSKGWVWAVLFFWGLPEGVSSVVFGKLSVFISYNYPGLLVGLSYGLGLYFGAEPGWIAVAATVGLGWSVTVAWGTAKYLGWLVSILGRWPPMGRA